MPGNCPQPMTKKTTCQDEYDPESLSIDAARTRILQALTPISGSEKLPLTACCGRILATDITANIAVPGFRNSAMDGYAFRHSDTATADSLEIVGKSMAGAPFTGICGDGQCIRIMTGAAVPAEFDTVVMQENTETDGDQITIHPIPSIGSNIRQAGSNIPRDTRLFRKYTRIDAAELGLLASIGINAVEVLRPLKVAYFSTGDELQPPNGTLGPGQIHDSNRYMLFALLQSPAIETLDLGILPDTLDAVTHALGEASHCDAVITSGGVSVGDADYVKAAVERTGKLSFWKILMKPGRPLSNGRLASGTQFFGLPGNPVSGMVTFHQFVAPALLHMLGQPYHQPLTLNATLTDPLSKLPGRVEFQRGILKVSDRGDRQVATTGLQDSHVLTSVHRANCYIELGLHSDGANRGDKVTVIPFSAFPKL